MGGQINLMPDRFLRESDVIAAVKKLADSREFSLLGTGYSFLPEVAAAVRKVSEAGAVPMDYHERCLGIEIQRRFEVEKKVPRWRNVKDELPEDDASYLVWLGDGYEVALYMGDGEWCMRDMSNITRLVTHWMPLPEAPQEEMAGTPWEEHEKD